MPEKETLKELRNIQKNKENWENRIDKVAEKLDESYSVKLQDTYLASIIKKKNGLYSRT